MRGLVLSLLLAPAILAGQSSVPPSATLSQKTDSIEAWPENATFVESPGLTYDIGTPKFKDGPDIKSGYRLLRTVVKPGEKLEFTLKAEEDKVSMRAFVPVPPPKSLDWRMSLRNANRPRRYCRKHMTIENTTPEPQVLVLIIFGTHKYSYRVDLQRTPKA